MSAKKFFSSVCAVAMVCALVAGCGSETTTSPTSVEAPILPPQDVMARQMPSGDVIITWTANTQSNLRGYNVYRLEVGGTAIQKLTVTPTNNTRHIDGNVEWTKAYEYRVTSVSVKGSESTPMMSQVQLEDPSLPGDRKTRPGE